jgi:hypothetical protein
VASIAAPAPALAPARIPSWPNQAVLCFLFTPAVSLIAAPFLLHQGEFDSSESDEIRMQQIRWMTISVIGCLVTTVPLAARMAFAPLFATVLTGLVLFLNMAFNSAPGNPLSWITLGGIGLAWVGRSAFFRPWDPAKFLGWTRDGYRRLLAPDRWAVLRLIGGIVLFLGGIAFLLSTGTALRRYIPVSRPVAQFLAIPSFVGAFLAGSGLSWTERPEPSS